MDGPTLWLRRERPLRMLHRFDGVTATAPIVVLSPDPVEAADAAAAMRERQRQ